MFLVGQNVPAQGRTTAVDQMPCCLRARGVSPSEHWRGSPSADQKGNQARGGSQGGWGGGRMRGQNYFPLFLVLPFHIVSRGLRFGRGLLPPCLCFGPGNALKPSLRLLRKLPFILGTVGLPPHHILATSSMCMHPRSCNMSAVGIKKGRN
jgi:hypothetical protein